MSSRGWVSEGSGCRGNIRSRRLKLGCGDLFFCHQMRRMGIRLEYGYSVGDAGGFGHICSAGVHGLQTLNPKPLNPIQKGFPACHERPRGSRDHRDLVSFCKDLKGCGVHMKVNTRKIWGVLMKRMYVPVECLQRTGRGPAFLWKVACERLCQCQFFSLTM